MALRSTTAVRRGWKNHLTHEHTSLMSVAGFSMIRLNLCQYNSLAEGIWGQLFQIKFYFHPFLGIKSVLEHNVLSKTGETI